MDESHAGAGAVSRRTVLRAGAGSAAFASLAGLLAACQSGSAGSSGSSGSAGKPTGKPIKQLTIGLPGSLSNLYPGQEAGILNYYVAALVMEGLVYVDPNGITRPAVASSWTRPDAQTYVYNIRPDAKFSDGSPVTVDDVLYSFQMARDAKASPGIASYYGAVKTITQTGKNQITVKLSTPSESFEWVPSAPGALFIAPKAFWQKNKGQIGTPQALLEGTGPYRVTSFAPDSHVRLEPTGTWWGGKPPVDAIQINFIANDSARYLAEKSGAIQMSFNVPLDAVQQWQTLPGNRVLSVPDRSWAGLIFNTKVAPTSDVHVRRAIAHCIDRAAVVKELLHGQGQVATAMSTPEQFAGVYTPQQASAKLAAIPQLGFSLAQAKAELAKSSVPHGFSTTLEYPNTGPQLGTAALSLAANLKKIGITLQVKEVTISQWLANLSAPKQLLRYMWYFNTTPDPAELVSYLLASSPPNLAGYVNKQVGTLLGQASVELDAAKRATLIIEAQKAAAADLPYLPLWWGRSLTSFSDHVGVKNYSSYIFESPWASNLYSAA
ncbi:MAG TPA: ABC transporter substrate-binding protein [Streptosporangiaceae bacterium]